MSKLLGNLRYQIALILLLAIVPLALLAIWLAIDDGREDANRARAESRATVLLVTQDLNRVIRASSDLVFGLANNPVIRDHLEACDAQLASLKPAFPQFANMAVIDLDSNVLCAASNPLKVRSLRQYPENLALMDRVGRSRRVAVGSFVISAPGKRVVPVMGPVIDRKGRVNSFFFVTVDLQWLDEQVNRVAIPAEAVLLVMDSRGREIARNPRSPDWPAGTPAPPLERTLVGKGDFNGDVKGYDGIDRVYSVSTVHAGADHTGEDLLVVMKMRSSAIYRSARRRLALHLGGLASVGLLMLGLTWTGSNRYFTHPLSKLIEAANRLASGSPKARSEIPYRGEIGVLAQSFDRMADALEQEQVRALKTSEAFRSIIEGTSAATGEDFFRSLVHSLGSALEADFALVGELTPDFKSVRTLAICADGKLIENTVYELRGTPCEGVVNTDACYYPDRIQELFPEDAMLHDLGMNSYLAAPLLDENGRALGLIAVLKRRPMTGEVTDPLSMLRIFAARACAELTRLSAERALRQSVAEREKVAARNEEMVRTLQALNARLESVREEERTRIAREIHDELGQQLTALRFDLVDFRNHPLPTPANGDAAVPRVGRFTHVLGMVDAMIAGVRRIATELRPALLDTFGLNAAIEWLAEDFQARTKICCAYEGVELAIDRELSTTVFRICQESLTNVARHAQASAVRIRLKAEEGWLSLQVSDNGKGISPEALINTRSLGVVGMRERARIAGGELIIGRGADGGASITARFPLQPCSVPDSGNAAPGIDDAGVMPEKSV
ncbi:MAG TPA: cache domain-containing protein [Bryobacteraceae bacterium]|jgi:signal transduction histidine kinase|nr:cache domain-containing protein [Bryobacteraceae bacterium]